MAEEKKEVKEQEGIVWHENTEAPEFYPEKLIPVVIKKALNEELMPLLTDNGISFPQYNPDHDVGTL